MNQETLAQKFELFKEYDYSEKEIDLLFDEEENIRAKLNQDVLKKFKDDVSLFYRMLRDSFSGKYHDSRSEFCCCCCACVSRRIVRCIRDNCI